MTGQLVQLEGRKAGPKTDSPARLVATLGVAGLLSGIAPALRMTRLDRIINVDSYNHTATVQAGVLVADLVGEAELLRVVDGTGSEEPAEQASVHPEQRRIDGL